MHLPYPEQMRYKTGKVKNDLVHIGGLDVVVENCLPCGAELGYRNKIEVPFGLLNGRPAFGFYAAESHRIVPFETCPVHCKEGDQVFRQLRNLILDSGIQPYDERSHSPGLRHVLLKTAVTTSETLAVLVTNGFAVPGIEALAQKIQKAKAPLKGVVQNNNPQKGNAILGKTTRVLAGKNGITEKILGISFELDALSFFQVNTAQTEKLLQTVERFTGLTGKERLLDVYCGVGLFSLYLAGKAEKAIGIESAEEAVSRARFNAGLNNIRNTEFLCADAAEGVRGVIKADVVILDPPRKGCDPGLIASLLNLSPARIVYVSCNPSTLARDLKVLTAGGYAAVTVQPVDMFPQTSHIETVVRIDRKD
jgi:23S rRNA (uracil1939-C5)-methyltransferase